MTTEDKIVKAIEAAARRISMQVPNVCAELHQIRIRENEPEMEEENEPEPETEEQPAEDKTEVRDATKAFQADTVDALECCTQSGGCKGCPLINDDRCANDLMIRALATIKQLRAKPEPRAEEHFELTESERDLIRIIKCCSRDDCENCGHEEDVMCVDHLVKRAFDLIERLLAEKGVDIDDL